MQVVIIGSGNVAYHLAFALRYTKHKIIQVIGRNKKETKAVANINDSKAEFSFSNIANADIYIIAVDDDAIESVVNKIPATDKIIVHTSGATSIDVLKSKFKNCGVMYPLQSISKNFPVSFRTIPFCVEASNKKAEQTTIDFVSSLSEKIIRTNSEQRLKLHLAAVLVNNFTNHLFAEAFELLSKSKLDFNLLLPLIETTVEKIKRANPRAVQTGPAKRKDAITIKKHLKLLNKDAGLKNLYSLFTKQIQKK